MEVGGCKRAIAGFGYGEIRLLGAGFERWEMRERRGSGRLGFACGTYKADHYSLFRNSACKVAET